MLELEEWIEDRDKDDFAVLPLLNAVRLSVTGDVPRDIDTLDECFGSEEEERVEADASEEGGKVLPVDGGGSFS